MTYLGIPKYAMSSVLDAFVFKKKRSKNCLKGGVNCILFNFLIVCAVYF